MSFKQQKGFRHPDHEVKWTRGSNKRSRCSHIKTVLFEDMDIFLHSQGLYQQEQEDSVRDPKEKNFLLNIEDYLSRLTPRQADVIRLRLIADSDGVVKSFGDIGHILGISKQIVHRHYLAAVKKLRKMLTAGQ
jgi:DNA-directed RNA polymerase sigma subunit (sigma70/sigma32)